MLTMLKNLFRKKTPTLLSAAETLKTAGDRIEKVGWSHDTPTKQDAEGNITHYCAEAAMASVHGGNPKAWGFIKAALTPVTNAANQLGGISVVGLANCQADMTKEIMVAAFRKAEADARAARA